MSQLRGLGQEDILHHQELGLLETVPDVVEVRVGDHRVLAHHIQRAHFAFLGSVQHLGNGQTDRERTRRAPGILELLLDFLR